jgi:dissimilatory sulfite reductase related protein
MSRDFNSSYLREVSAMADQTELKQKAEELARRVWDDEGIKARVKKMMEEGIPRKTLDPVVLNTSKAEILARVQRRAEEYNYILKNCAQGTAIALLEEFGLGSMEVIKALTPFPGIASTGEICGGITGSLIAFGLFFGSDDRFDLGAMNTAIGTGKRFVAEFEYAVGHRYCADIIEKIIIGRKLNPGESDEAMAAFAGARGFEKCGLLPGTGARLAAGFIIDHVIAAASPEKAAGKQSLVGVGKLELAGKLLEIDDQGFIQKFDEWNEDVARAYAARDGVKELTENHWKVMRYLRDYYASYGICPMVKKLTRDVELSLKEIYELFPEGPATSACKWSGIPKPQGCG